jgi:hypothetical protein
MGGVDNYSIIEYKIVDDLTPWHRVLIEKLTVTLQSNSPPFIEL